MVVDDNHLINESNRNIVNKCLTEMGLVYEIILCSDGIDIIKHLLDIKINKKIKIIITDENMEYINGSEAIQITRKLEEKNYIGKMFCISVTCHEDKNIVKNIISSGANYVIPKPLSIFSMKNILEKMKSL